jgi:putative photosynthetic complex assembly protein
MSAINAEPFPRWPLIAAGCLIAISIAGASIARFSRMAEPTPAAHSVMILGQAEVFRTFTFAPAADGAIAVIDPQTGRVEQKIGADEAGFIHGALRGLRRSRMVHGEPLDPTLTIARWMDGRVTVTDAATDTLIDLRAFGIDNKAAFERFLPPRSIASAAPDAASITGPNAGARVAIAEAAP